MEGAEDPVAAAVEAEVRRIIRDVERDLEREYEAGRVYATVRLTWAEKPGALMRWLGVAGRAAAGFYTQLNRGTRKTVSAEFAWGNPIYVPRLQPKTASEAVDALKAARDAEISRRGEPQDATEVFVASGDRRRMEELLERAYFVGSARGRAQAAAWARRMALSRRSFKVQKRAEGWWALHALVRDAAYATHEWKEVIGCGPRRRP
jgi:hypothetical protein